MALHQGVVKGQNVTALIVLLLDNKELKSEGGSPCEPITVRTVIESLPATCVLNYSCS